MMPKGKLFVISSPSGGGKTTLTQRLLEEVPDIERSVSVTTRPPRAGEIDGEDYYFINRDEFERRRTKGDFLEWARVFDDYYATPKARVDELVSSGKDVVLTIDVQGARQIKQARPEAVTIFIMPPSEDELARRLAGRNSDSDAAVKKRLEIARQEIKEKGEYDYVIINDSFEVAREELKTIVLKYRRSKE